MSLLPFHPTVTSVPPAVPPVPPLPTPCYIASCALHPALISVLPLHSLCSVCVSQGSAGSSVPPSVLQCQLCPPPQSGSASHTPVFLSAMPPHLTVFPEPSLPCSVPCPHSAPQNICRPSRAPPILQSMLCPSPPHCATVCAVPQTLPASGINLVISTPLMHSPLWVPPIPVPPLQHPPEHLSDFYLKKKFSYNKIHPPTIAQYRGAERVPPPNLPLRATPESQPRVLAPGVGGGTQGFAAGVGILVGVPLTFPGPGVRKPLQGG